MTVAAPASDHAGDEELRDQARRISSGESADFGGRTIEAAWVRELVVAPGAFGAVSIKNATIAGQLNLRDVRASAGGACHAVILENCKLHPTASPAEPGLDASHSHLARLSLLDCETTGVELSDAVIAGALELDGLKPRPDGSCWVKARWLRVAGSLTARGAELRLPRGPRAASPPDDKNRKDLGAPFALDLSGADIGGALTLWPGFVADGGVSLSGARIEAGVRAGGAQIDAAEIGSPAQAFFAQYVRVHGPVFLAGDGDDEPFRANGGVSLYGAEIDGVLDLSGCVVRARSEPDDPAAILMSSATIGGDALIYPAAVSTLSLNNATFGGDLAICAWSDAPIERIDATSCRVRGDVILQGPISGGDFSGCVIEGQLAFGDEYAPLELTGVNDIASIQLSDAHVGRDLRVRPITTNPGYMVGVDWTRRPLRVRTIRLECCRSAGWRIAEALYPPTSGTGSVILAFLYRETGDDVEVFALDGTSGPMYEIAGSLDVSTPELATEFLTFFCAYLWGAEGPFLIRPGTAKLERASTARGWAGEAVVEYGTAVFGAKFRFDPDDPDALVSMEDDEPLDQLPISTLEQRLFASPFRLYRPAEPDTTWPVPPAIRPEDAWQDTGAEGVSDQVWAALAEQDFAPSTVTYAPAGWPAPTIDLGGLKAASLDDADGRNWFEEDEVRPRVGRMTHRLVRMLRVEQAAELEHVRPKLRLQLTGFEYERIKQDLVVAQAHRTTRLGGDADTPEPTASPRGSWRPPGAAAKVVRDATGALRHPRRRLEARVRALGQPDADRDGTAELKASRLHARTAWIESQYSTYPPLQNEYHPEPYEQLARVWRTTGSLDEANSAIFEKIKMQGRLRPDPQWPGSKQRYYRFKRSLYSLLVASGVGAAVVRPARMFAIFLAVWIAGVFALYAAPDALKVKISPVIPVVSTAGGAAHVVLPASEVARSREEVACGHRASKVVYPLDLMIPFVDLGQEARCEFSLTSQGWGIAQGLYELLGWLLTGGVLLAFSGLVRRQFER